MDSPRLDQIEAEILKGLSDLARVLESFQRGSANAGHLLFELERGVKVPRNELQHCAQVFQRFSTDTALLALVKEIERRVTLDLVQPLRVRVNLDDRVGAPPQSMTTTSDDDAGIASARTGLLSATEGLEALLRGVCVSNSPFSR